MSESQLRMALLDASHGAAYTPRNFRRELDADLAEFDVTAGELPETFAYDAVVVTGSRSSVYDGDGWIADTKAWVSEAVTRGLPALGVCWGHQLLADVLGGVVGDMGEYEIGYREIERRTDGGVLFEGVPSRFTAFTTHSDEVIVPPPGAEVLAANDYSVQAFRRGSVFGVQFHPEYDMETAEEVARGKEALSEERLKSVLEGITEENFRASGEAKRIFESFCGYVRGLRRDDGAARGNGAGETGTAPPVEAPSRSGQRSRAGGRSERSLPNQ